MGDSETSSSSSESHSSTENSLVSEKHSATDQKQTDENHKGDMKVETETQEVVEQVVSSGIGDGVEEAAISNSEEAVEAVEEEIPNSALQKSAEEVQSETPTTESGNSKRLVSDAVPMMNTQQDVDLAVLTEGMQRMGNSSNKSSSPQPLKLENYPNVQGPTGNPVNHRPAYNSYQATGNLANRSRPEEVSVWASGNRNAPAPQPLNIPPAVYQVPAQATATSPVRGPGEAGGQPHSGRKVSSGSTTYIGSRVISEQTGPSLTIMLRRPTSERQWGFNFHGGAEYGCPPFVNKISKHGLAVSFGLELGDVLVSISNSLTVGKTQDQLKAEVLRAGNELDLIVIRRGVDLAKIAELVPQALPTSPRSPSSNSPLSSRENSTLCVFDESRQRSARSLNRPNLYRPVRTKSMRILEDQLDAGQATSAVATKQHFQGARGLAAQGERSSFTQAYGETQTGGYAGRAVVASAAPCETALWPQRSYNQQQIPSHRQPEQMRAQQNYRQSEWGQSPSQPPTAWGGPAVWSGQPQAPVVDTRFAGRSDQSTYYPSNVNQDLAASPTYTSSTTVTIPVRGRQSYNSHMTR